MAAALIPLAATLLPEIIELIAGLVHKKAPAAEEKGPGTGAVKFADVFASVMNDLAKAHAAGTIAGPIPDDASVKAIIQAVVSSMKLLGMLNGVPAEAAPSPASRSSSAKDVSWILAPGQVITITGGAL